MSFFDRWRGTSEDDEAPDDATRRLLSRARALPRESEPERDLWMGIENRIRAASAPDAQPARARSPLFGVFPRPALAAACALTLVVTTALATLWLSQPQLPSTQTELRLLADELRQRDGVSDVHERLLAVLETRRDSLPPEALLALEDSVQQIDRALAELNVALRQHPENPELRFLLAETYRREADLLERMVWWVQTPEEVDS
jgi:hypothetical protein